MSTPDKPWEVYSEGLLDYTVTACTSSHSDCAYCGDKGLMLFMVATTKDYTELDAYPPVDAIVPLLLTAAQAERLSLDLALMVKALKAGEH